MKIANEHNTRKYIRQVKDVHEEQQQKRKELIEKNLENMKNILIP
jgi:hypothetical protein